MKGTVFFCARQTASACEHVWRTVETMVLWTCHGMLCSVLRRSRSGCFTRGRSLSVECCWHAAGPVPRAFLEGYHEPPAQNVRPQQTVSAAVRAWCWRSRYPSLQGALEPEANGRPCCVKIAADLQRSVVCQTSVCMRARACVFAVQCKKRPHSPRHPKHRQSRAETC